MDESEEVSGNANEKDAGQVMAGAAASQVMPAKKRNREGEWKRLGRVETRRGRKRYDKVEGEVPCEVAGCDRVY